MKTPMQELIDIIKKRQEDDEAMPFMYNDKIIALAESMLEKEKEQMRLIYNGLLQNVGTSIKQSDLPTFEEYYEHTYGGNK